MKNKTILTIAAVVLGALLVKKKQSGVGAIKPYIAISELQQLGVPMGVNYNNLQEETKQKITQYAWQKGYRQTKASAARYSYGEAFYRSLNSAYKKAVSGIYYDAELADGTEYPVYDDDGRVALIYRDRSDFPMLRQLYADITEPADMQQVRDDSQAYWATVAYIASGGKFIWKDKNTGGIKDECFATRGNAAEERRKRISYIAGRDKGGTGIQTLAEKWSANGGDYMATRDGIIRAIQNIQSSGEAKKMLESEALRRIDDVSKNSYEQYETPF